MKVGFLKEEVCRLSGTYEHINGLRGHRLRREVLRFSDLGCRRARNVELCSNRTGPREL